MHASTSKLSCSLNPQKDMDESEMEGLSDAQTARVHQLNVTSLDKILKVLIRPMTDPWGLVFCLTFTRLPTNLPTKISHPWDIHVDI